MRMMYYSVNGTELYSETGYPSPTIRSRTEVLPITDTELQLENGISECSYKESNSSHYACLFGNSTTKQHIIKYDDIL